MSLVTKSGTEHGREISTQHKVGGIICRGVVNIGGELKHALDGAGV